MTEVRLRAIGQTDDGRFVFIVFLMRQIDGQEKIRPISARPMHKKEIKHYGRQDA